MNARVHSGGIIIVLTFLLAFMLTMLPMPEWARYLPPFWVVLVTIYWVMALPMRVGVGIAWLAGLVLDVVDGTLMGQQALALAVIAFLTIRLHQRMRLFPLIQQSTTVFILCLLFSLINLWVRGITGQAPDLWTIFIPSFSSALVWPFIFLAMRFIRRQYQVA